MTFSFLFVDCSIVAASEIEEQTEFGLIVEHLMVVVVRRDGAA